MISIKIEQTQIVWKKQRNWNRMLDEPKDGHGQCAYVEAELPTKETKLLLEQTIPEESFDLKEVIKAINKL